MTYSGLHLLLFTVLYHVTYVSETNKFPHTVFEILYPSLSMHFVTTVAVS